MAVSESLLINVKVKKDGTVTKTAVEMSQFEKTINDLRKEISLLVKSTESLSVQNKDLSESYSTAAKEISKNTNEIKKTTDIFSGLAFTINNSVMAFESLSNSYSQVVELFGVESRRNLIETLEVFSKISQSSGFDVLSISLKSAITQVIKLDESVARLAKSFGINYEAINQNSNALQTFSSGVYSTVSSVYSLFLAFQKFVELFGEENRKKLINLLRILAVIAQFKGFDRISTALNESVSLVKDLDSVLTKYHTENALNLEKTADQLETQMMLYNATKAAAAGVAVTLTTFTISQALKDLFKFAGGFDGISAKVSKFKDSTGTLSSIFTEAAFHSTVFFDDIINGSTVGSQRVGYFQRVLNNIPKSFQELKNGNFVEIISAPFMNAFSKIADAAKFSANWLIGTYAGAFDTVAQKVKSTTAAMGAASVAFISRNAIAISEFATIAQAPLLAIGHAALTSDSSLIKLAGTISIVAAILMGGFATAVVFALAKIGSFTEAIGDSLINSMNRMEEKFIKSQSIMNQFSFVVQGYAKTMGVDAVGSLDLWQNKIAEITSKTTLSTDEVAKSIKLLIAEGSALGLSLAQNLDLFNRAVDLSVSQGRELSEVVVALASGMLGQSQSVLSLGINLKESHLEHSKFLLTQQKLLIDLKESEKVQLRYNEVMKQTVPVVGAAASEMNTIAGNSKKLEQQIEQLEIRLGSMNDITRAFIILQQKLVSSFLDLPGVVLDLIGILIDFGGVFFKVTGVIIKYTLTISALAIAYKTLLWATSQNMLAQAILSGAMSILGKAVGVQTIAVTSLSAAWSNLLLILRGGIIMALKTVLTTVGAVTIGILKFSAALLANPMTWVIAGMTTVIFAFIKAADEIIKELSYLKNMFSDTGESVSVFGDVISSVLSFLGSIWRTFFSTVKLSLLGIIQLVLLAQLGFYKLKAALASSKDEQEKYNKLLEQTGERLDETSALARKTADQIGLSFGGVAHAAENAGNQIDGLSDSTELYALRAKKLTEVLGSLNQEAVKIGVLGTEFERASLAIKMSKDELNKLTQEFLSNGAENKDALEQIKAKTEDLWRSEFELQKLRNSTITDFSQKSKQLEIDRLRASGNVIAAIKQEFQAQRSLIDTQIEGLKQTGPLTDQQIARIRQLKSAINQAEQAAILEEQNKKLKEQASVLSDIKKENANIALEIEGANLGQSELIDRTFQAEMEKLDIKRQQLVAEQKLTDEIAAQLDMQADLLHRRAAEQKEKIGKTEIIPRQTIDALKASVGDGAAELASGISDGMASFAGGVGAIMGAVNGVLDFFKQLIDFIPGILNKLADVINSLTELPLKILEGLNNLLNSIINFVRNFIPNMIKAVQGIFRSLVEFIFELPLAVKDMLAEIPGLLMELLKELPSLVENFIAGLMNAIPDITLYFIEFLILEFPRIAMKFVEVVAYRLPIAIVKGIIKGMDLAVKRLVAVFKNIFTGAKIPKELSGLGKSISDGAKRLASQIAKETDQIFSVKDLKDAAKGFDESERIKEAIDDGVNWLLKAWRWIIEKLRAVGKFFKEIWDGAINFFEEVGKSIVTGLQMAWKMAEDIFNGIIKGIKDAFQLASDWIRKSISYLSDVWMKIISAGEIFSDSWKTFVNFMKSVFDGFVTAFSMLWEGVKSLFDGIIKAFKDAFDFGAGLFQKAFDFLKEVGEKIFDAKAIKQAWDKIVDSLDQVFSKFIDAVRPAFEFVKNIFDEIINALKPVFEFLKNVFDQFISALRPLVDFIKSVFSFAAEGLSRVFDKLASAASQLGGIFSSFIDGIKVAFSQIGIGLSGAWDRIKEIFSGFFNSISDAFKNPVEAFKSIISSLQNGISSLGSVGTQMKDAILGMINSVSMFINNLGTSLTSFVERLKAGFSDLITQLQNIPSNILNGIRNGINSLGDIGSRIWDGFISAMSKGQSWFGTMGNQLANGLKNALDAINPINLFKKMFSWDGGGKGKIERALGIDVPFVSFAQGGMVPGKAMVPGDSPINDRILALLSPGEYVIPRSAMNTPGVKELVASVVSGDYKPPQYWDGKIGGYIGQRAMAVKSGGVSGAVDQAKDLGGKIASGGKQAWTEIENAGQAVLDELAKLDPSQLWKMVEEKIWGSIWKMIESSAPRFHTGGLVPSYANGGEVLSFLQPGEFVMQKSSVQQNGLDFMNRLNNGQSSGSSNQVFNFDVNLKIDASAQSLDETFVRNKLMPAIKTELKKSSLRGEFLLSDRGLR